ncbi:MAG TPA: hypothetical protein EYP57_00690 [Thermodesulfobacteriaceae bacterium]|nr:hypothetical protein [Thermodesulfobacteriaceae bacterium]
MNEFSKIFLASFMILILSSCAAHESQSLGTAGGSEKSLINPEDLEFKSFPEEHNGPREPAIKPRFKKLSPLDTQELSMAFVDEDYQNVFQILAHTAGLNLVIDPEVGKVLGERRRLTAEYQHQSIRDILYSACRSLDITWNQKGNTIYICASEKRIFNLDFLGSVRQALFNVGGDVLGGGDENEDIITPLSGSFEVSGRTSETVTDIYKGLEEAIKARIGEDGTLFLNRQTGTLLVRARPRIMDEISTYIDTLRSKYRRQVLIEAKIIEVDLKKDYELGIDWRLLDLTISSDELEDIGTIGRITTEILNDSLLYKLVLRGDRYNVRTAVHALEEFGTLNLLSNPRLKAMNGQSAVISVGQSISYLKQLTYDRSGTSGVYDRSVNADIGSVFNGVLLGVTPIIEDHDMVSLHLVPIKSDLIDMEEREFSDGSTFSFPKVNLREVSTVVRARSGDVIIIGGLVQEKEQTGDSGLPFLKHLPGMGRLFTYKHNQTEKVELVILLKIWVSYDEHTV